MKRSILIAIMVLVLILIVPVAMAADSPQRQAEDTGYIEVNPEQPVFTPEVLDSVTPLPGVESEVLGLTMEEACPAILLDTTTSEVLKVGLEIRLFKEDELQASLPYEEATILTYSERASLTQEEQEQFTKAYEEALAVTDTTLVNFFWIDIPEEYESLLRTQETYVNDDGEEVTDGEYLELRITKTGTNITCTVNGKAMEVEDLKDGTVILKLTETGAVAVFADVPTSEALALSSADAVPDVLPDVYTQLLTQPVPAIAICDYDSDEKTTAVSTEDVTFIPVEYITILDPEDQALFLQAFEDIRDNPSDQKLCYFFWLGIPSYYEELLSDPSANENGEETESGKYLRVMISIPGDNVKVTVNGTPVETENVESDVYVLKLTCSGAVAVYSDSAEDTADDDTWHRDNS